MALEEHMRQKQHYTVEMQEQEKQAFLEDQRVMQGFAQLQNAPFQASSKKSTARNHRDYMVYQKMQARQAQPYGLRQEAAQYIAQRCARFDTSGESMPLRVEDTMLHLCESKLLEKEVDQELLKTLTDHLLAESMWREEDNPNAKRQQEMSREGMQGLREIYFRHLEAMDKKYGESLIKMTPSQYLKAMPGIQADFAVVEDMSRFFRAYPLSEEPTQQLMQAKLEFYSGVWENLQIREEKLIQMDPEVLNGKGELTKAARQEHERKLKVLRDSAREKKAFSARKNRPDLMAPFLKNQEKKQQALEVLSNRQAQEQKQQERQAPIPLNLTYEQAGEQIQNLLHDFQRFGEIVVAVSDDTLVNSYPQMLDMWNQLKARYQALEDYMAGLEVADVDHLELWERCVEYRRSNPDSSLIAQKRMRDIAAHGCTQGNDLMETENKLRAQIWQEQMEQIQGPLSMEDAIEKVKHILADGIDLNGNWEEWQQKLPLFFENLKALRKLQEIKENAPDYYRLSQSYADYVFCERALNLLPVYEQAMSLQLRLHRLQERGGATEQELKAQLDVCSETFARMVERELMQPLTPQEQQLAPEQQLRQVLELTQRKENYARQLLDQVEITQKKLEKVKKWGGLSFLELPVQEGMDQTSVEDLRDAAAVAGYKEGRRLEIQQTPPFLRLIQRFDREYSRLEAQLVQQDHYSDWGMVQSFAQLSQCAQMGQFIKNRVIDRGAFDLLEEMAEYQDISETYGPVLERVRVNIKKVIPLFHYSTGLMLQRADETQVVLCAVKTVEVQTLNGEQEIQAEAVRRMQLGAEAVNKLRANHEQEQRARELELLEGVNREKIVSRHKGERDVAVVNTGMQAASFLFRTRRKDGYGAGQYGKAKEIYQTYQKALNGSDVLEAWQRGDSDAVPAIELKDYYSSPMKAEIIRMLNRPQIQGDDFRDFWGDDFLQAVEAIKQYCGVEGIVNLDTARMEMAFLDQFRLCVNTYMEGSEGLEGEVDLIRERRQLLREVTAVLEENLNGTLAQTMTVQEMATLDAATVAYVEDTTLRENLEQSNIKDIPLFLHEPNLNDVRQSTIGDCWLLSAVSAVVKMNPALIRSMFHDLGDGNVMVRLYDDRQKPCYFKLRKQFESGYGNACDCTWVQLLEKAYALSGFNGWCAMEVRGNHLYNVAKELTDGNVRDGILHLTGIRSVQRQTSKWANSKTDFDFVMGAVHGISSGEKTPEGQQKKKTAEKIKAAIRLYGDSILPTLPREQRENFSYEQMFDWMKARGRFDEFIVEEGAEATKEQRDAFLAPYQAMVMENIRNMREGILLPGREENQEEVWGRQRYVEMFEKDWGDYPPQVVEFILQCRNTLQAGGGVSISSSHCMNVIDVKKHNGKYFMLVRDPFNIYNTVYTKEKGVTKSRSQGFSSVPFHQWGNRTLMENREDMILGSFRGTSWVEAGELFESLELCDFIRPEQFA